MSETDPDNPVIPSETLLPCRRCGVPHVGPYPQLRGADLYVAYERPATLPFTADVTLELVEASCRVRLGPEDSPQRFDALSALVGQRVVAARVMPPIPLDYTCLSRLIYQCPSCAHEQVVPLEREDDGEATFEYSALFHAERVAEQAERAQNDDKDEEGHT